MFSPSRQQQRGALQIGHRIDISHRARVIYVHLLHLALLRKVAHYAGRALLARQRQQLGQALRRKTHRVATLAPIPGHRHCAMLQCTGDGAQRLPGPGAGAAGL